VDQIDSHKRKEVAIGPFPTVIMHVNNIFPALFFFLLFFRFPLELGEYWEVELEE
jgi:hypothetical protein